MQKIISTLLLISILSCNVMEDLGIIEDKDEKKKEKQQQNLLLLLLLNEMNKTELEYGYRFYSVAKNSPAFGSLGANCGVNGGVIMQLEQRAVKVNSREVIGTPVRSCLNFQAPDSSCYHVVNISSPSCNAIAGSQTSQDMLSQYWNTEGGTARSVLFCYADSSCPNPVSTPSAVYQSRATFAMNVWDVGLNSQSFLSDRNLDDPNVYKPSNWITVGDDACNAAGVPSSLKGAGCPFNNVSVIGVCQIRTLVGSGILDSTLLIRKSYQDSAITTESRKRAVFVHEVGHCLGLAHSTNLGRIMYPFISDVAAPTTEELNALKEAYPTASTVAEPSNATTLDFFFFQGSGGSESAIRHYQFPKLWMDSNMGYSGGSGSGFITGSMSDTSAASADGTVYTENGKTVYTHYYYTRSKY